MPSRNRRVLYRFVGTTEKNQLVDARATFLQRVTTAADRMNVTDHAENQLVARMQTLIAQPDIGNAIFNHSMAAGSGGRIGGGSSMVSMTTDYDALANSTDPAVRQIVANAPYMAVFVIPTEGILGGASGLSQAEGEVFVANIAAALAVCLADSQSNPHRNPYSPRSSPRR